MYIRAGGFVGLSTGHSVSLTINIDGSGNDTGAHCITANKDSPDDVASNTKFGIQNKGIQ